MPVKIGNLIHSTPPDTAPLTACGLPYDAAAKYRGSDTDCVECLRSRTRRFIAGGEEWDRRNPNAQDEELIDELGL